MTRSRRPFDSAVALLRIYPTHLSKDQCARIFIVPLQYFQDWKQKSISSSCCKDLQWTGSPAAHSRCSISGSFYCKGGRSKTVLRSTGATCPGFQAFASIYRAATMCRGFLFIIANLGHNSNRKTKFVGGTEVGRPECKTLKGGGKCSTQQILV